MGKKIIIVSIIASILFLTVYIPNKNKEHVEISYVDEIEEQTKEETSMTVSASDLKLLAQFIKFETNDEETVSKLGVGMVILNRVNSPNFPNTISEVIYQPGYFGLPEEGLESVEITNPDIQIVSKILDLFNNKTPITDEKGNDISTAFYWYDPTITDAETITNLENQYTPLGQIDNRKFLAENEER